MFEEFMLWELQIHEKLLKIVQRRPAYTSSRFPPRLPLTQLYTVITKTRKLTLTQYDYDFTSF